MNTTKNYKKNIKNKSDATINKQTKMSIGSGARDKDKAPQGGTVDAKSKKKIARWAKESENVLKTNPHHDRKE